MNPGIYLFKEEFCKQLNIPMNQPNRRKDELLLWLENFYDFRLLEGRPIRIEIIEVIGEYQQLPRKCYDSASRIELTKEKVDRYEGYTISAIGEEYKPNSKTKIARDAIKAFGNELYGHVSYEAVAKRYVKPAFDKNAETNDVAVWVWRKSYEPISEDEVEKWRQILSQCKIDRDEAANAFYMQAQGEDISDKEMAYRRAMMMMKNKYGDFPVYVKEWRLKK